MRIACRQILALLVALVYVVHPAQAESESVDLAREILAEINLARIDPQAYTDHLRNFRRYYQGTGYRLPGQRELIITSEGVSAVDEAIRVLSRHKPVPPLAWSSGLAAAAEELVRDQGLTGATGHEGTRCGGPRERIDRQGEWQGWISENVSYGPDVARHVVIQLIIDDGVPGRGHRANLFSPHPRKAGIACGPHPTFGIMCVTDFAQGFSEKRQD